MWYEVELKLYSTHIKLVLSISYSHSLTFTAEWTHSYEKALQRHLSSI